MVEADDVPLLVRVLAGNQVTGAAVLFCLDAADTGALRRLHPAVAGAVASVPWADMTTIVRDIGRWRAALPGAVGAKLRVVSLPLVATALAGVTCLTLSDYFKVTDEVLRHLPTSLRTLRVSECNWLTEDARFAHLTALVSLDCSRTRAVSDGATGLPPSLQELDVSIGYDTAQGGLSVGASLAHLVQLRVLRAHYCVLNADTLASLSPSLVELDAQSCRGLPADASFGRLHALQKLNVAWSAFSDAGLARLPPSLVHLGVRGCAKLTPAAVLPPLPALRLLDVSSTNIGDALVASLPAGLTELRLVRCSGVTAHATLDHVPALRALHSSDAKLAPAVVAECRARGCVAPAAGELCKHMSTVVALAVLDDGRLASGDSCGKVLLWNNAAAGGDATATVLQAGGYVRALAALPDGRSLAVGVGEGTRWCVEVWEVTWKSPVRAAIVLHGCTVFALAVLADGRLAAGCDDGVVRVVGVAPGVVDLVTAVLGGGGSSRISVTALAALPDGTLAVGTDGTVRVWDVGRQACMASLGGHIGRVWSLAVLADGRLAVGARGGDVALWDVRSRSRVGMLTGRKDDEVAVLAALPDGRLVSGSEDGDIQLWDTRPAAAAASSRAASTAPMTVLAHAPYGTHAFVPLSDGRLATAYAGRVLLWAALPPPAPYE